MLITIFSMFAVVVAFILWFIAIYNRFIKLRNLKEEGWSGIDIQLKRRSNLVPNLVESVKGYMVHERGVHEEVTKQRALSMSAGNISDKIAFESALSIGLDRLFAVAENYPDLKANQNFLDLQKQMSELEDEIQMARRYYNGTVRNLNIGMEIFPNSIVANLFHFEKAEFFEIADAHDRAVPRVDLTV